MQLFIQMGGWAGINIAVWQQINIQFLSHSVAMLLSQQEEQYKYFYIDRKFVSGNLQLIHDALDEIDLFLAKMKKIDLINSLILRMVDLLPNTKSLLLKHRVASIFKHHYNLLLTIHCRDQIANSLAKYIRAHDQLTRVVALQIMADLSSLFLKDIAVYHTLLSKLSQNNSLSKVQKKEAIICLSIILTQSNPIAKLFAQNINSLHRFYAIPLHIILYLLSHIPLDSHLQIPLLEELNRLFTTHQTSNQKQYLKHTRKVTKYLQKVVVNYAHTNYRIVGLYQRKLREKLPNIAKIIDKIKSTKYSFLLPAEIEPEHQSSQPTFEQLIDQVYSKKVNGQLLKQGQHYNQKLYTFIDDALAINQNPQKIVLLFYFIEDISHYDRTIKKKITTKLIPVGKTLLKQLIVVGCFESALFLLNSIDIPQTNYLFFKAYIEFKMQKEPKKIDQLRQITQIINQDLFQIVKAWQIIDKMLRLWLATSNPTFQLHKQLKTIYLSLKQNKQFPQLIQIIKMFVNCKQSENVQNLKNRCFPLLPSTIMNTNSFWFAHLNKKTVLSIFNMVL